ncbi:MAG: hypothetical protein KKF44_03895 [Nanoarchaeota archaeon]|nr:hypothetical protein [Nanoarchaeota archaeon]
MGKKANITTYTIIGIIIVFIISLYSSTQLRSNKMIVLDEMMTSISNFNTKVMFDDYMDNCVDHAYKTASDEVGFSDDTRIDFERIARGSIVACTAPLVSRLESQGYQVVQGSPNAALELREETALLHVKYPTSITRDEAKIEFENTIQVYPRNSWLDIPGGITEKDETLISPDRRVYLKLEEGTEIRSHDGEPVERIGFKILDRNYNGLENNNVIGEKIYDLVPDAMKFSKPAAIEFRFKKNEVPNEASAMSGRIGWLWEETNIWLMYETDSRIEGDDYILSTQITHASIHAGLTGIVPPFLAQGQSVPSITGMVTEPGAAQVTLGETDEAGWDTMGCAKAMMNHYAPFLKGGSALIHKYTPAEDLYMNPGIYNLDWESGVWGGECHIELTPYKTEIVECKIEGDKFILEKKGGVSIEEDTGSYGGSLLREGATELALPYESRHFTPNGLICCCQGNNCEGVGVANCDDLNEWVIDYDEFGKEDGGHWEPEPQWRDGPKTLYGIATDENAGGCWESMTTMMPETTGILYVYETNPTVGARFSSPKMVFPFSFYGDACIDVPDTEVTVKDNIIESINKDLKINAGCEVVSGSRDSCYCDIKTENQGGTLTITLTKLGCDETTHDIRNELYDTHFTLDGGTASGSFSIRTCFERGTRILTLEGDKNIEDIIVGDVVMSYNITSGDLVPNVVLKNYERYADKMMTIMLRDDTVLNATPEHPFYDGTDYKPISEFNVNDILYLLKNGKLKPVKIKEMQEYDIEKTKVYNLKVAGNFNYFANGVLNHNFGYSPEIQSCLSGLGTGPSSLDDFGSCICEYSGFNNCDGEHMSNFLSMCMSGEMPTYECSLMEECIELGPQSSVSCAYTAGEFDDFDGCMNFFGGGPFDEMCGFSVGWPDLETCIDVTGESIICEYLFENMGNLPTSYVDCYAAGCEAQGNCVADSYCTAYLEWLEDGRLTSYIYAGCMGDTNNPDFCIDIVENGISQDWLPCLIAGDRSETCLNENFLRLSEITQALLLSWADCIVRNTVDLNPLNAQDECFGEFKDNFAENFWTNHFTLTYAGWCRMFDSSSPQCLNAYAQIGWDPTSMPNQFESASLNRFLQTACLAYDSTLGYLFPSCSDLWASGYVYEEECVQGNQYSTDCEVAQAEYTNQALGTLAEIAVDAFGSSFIDDLLGDYFKYGDEAFVTAFGDDGVKIGSNTIFDIIEIEDSAGIISRVIQSPAGDLVDIYDVFQIFQENLDQEPEITCSPGTSASCCLGIEPC